MSKKNIAIFGSLTQDLFAYPEENTVISQSSETEKKQFYALPYGGKINAKYLERHGGGGAGNISTSFQRLGLQSICFGAVGDDEIANWIIKKLKTENINIENIQHKKNCESGFSIILNGFDGERTVIFTSQANTEFSEISVQTLEKKNCEAIYLCHLSSNNSEKIRKNILEYLNKKSEILFAWNPGKETLSQGLEKNKKLLHQCNLLFLNKEEAELLTGINANYLFNSHGEKKRKKTMERNDTKIKDDLPSYASDCEPMAKEILKYGVETVIITDGSRGAQIFTKNNSFFSPPISKERKDSLGAGDGYASAFTASILHGKDLQNAAKYASMNAASVVTFRGAQDGLLRESELYR